MDAALLTVIFRGAHMALASNLEGVTDADALSGPEPGGNSLNWVVGHILVSRDQVHGLLGLGPAWTESLGENGAYRRGSRSFVPASAIPLSRIRGALTQSQELLLGTLGQASPEQLAKPGSETRTVGELLAFLGFHEGYHVGQVGLLRRLSGRAGAIA
jgi:uncharacterized damage-inducible protein DinB